MVRIALTPELPYLPGLFAPSIARARLAAEVLALAAREESRVRVEWGDRGLLWSDVVAWFGFGRDEHPGWVLGSGSAWGLLREIERRAGGDAVRARWIEDPRGDLAPVFADGSLGGLSSGSVEAARDGPRFALFSERTVGGTRGPAFAFTSACEARRVQPGSYLGIDGDVEFLFWPARSRTEELRAAVEKSAHCILPNPGDVRAEDLVEFEDLCARYVDAFGNHRVSFGERMGPPVRGPAIAGASWAWFHGLESEVLRDWLHRMTERHFPRYLGALHLAFTFLELGIDPLEEMYLGNHLADRNAELLQNIVP